MLPLAYAPIEVGCKMYAKKAITRIRLTGLYQPQFLNMANEMPSQLINGLDTPR
jgi:hypothetical protein